MSWWRYSCSFLQVLDTIFNFLPNQTHLFCFYGLVGNVPVSAAQRDAWRRWFGGHESVPARSLSDPGSDSRACAGHAGRGAGAAERAHLSTNAASLHDPSVTPVVPPSQTFHMQKCSSSPSQYYQSGFKKNTKCCSRTCSWNLVAR